MVSVLELFIVLLFILLVMIGPNNTAPNYSSKHYGGKFKCTGELYKPHHAFNCNPISKSSSTITSTLKTSIETSTITGSTLNSFELWKLTKVYCLDSQYNLEEIATLPLPTEYPTSNFGDHSLGIHYPYKLKRRKSRRSRETKLKRNIVETLKRILKIEESLLKTDVT